MDNTSDKAGYEVGYGKPPVKSRFRAGQSGNPRGRTKGKKNFKTDLTEELRERIRVREGDRTIKISKQRGIVKSVVSRSLKGDARAANLLVNTMLRVLDPNAVIEGGNSTLTAEEAEVLRDVERRLLSDQDASTESAVKREKGADDGQSR